MAAAAAEFATVFLETTLGTRLVVSFPANATTVADLKRQVSAEHAACFPGTGPIAVKSLQVKHDGSLFHLTDSMAVEGAFRWVKGPWHILVEVHELRSHPLVREDAERGSCDGSEQNAGNPVVRNSTQNTSSPAVSEGDGELAIGDGIPMLDQLHENHQGIKCASNRLEAENTVPPESSDIYLDAGGSDNPSMVDLKGQSYEGVEHALGQRKDGTVKTMLQECSDLYFDADGSGNPVGLQDKLCEGVKHALGHPEDGNVKTMLQESSYLNLTADESDPRAKKQLDKFHEDVEQALSRCKDGNVRIMLHESSDVDVAAVGGETPSENQQDTSYEGVKQASGQHKNGNVKAMFQANSDLDVAAGDGETPSENQQDKSYEGVKHVSGQHKNGNVNAMFQENSDLDVTAGEGVTSSMNKQNKYQEGVKHALGQHKNKNVKAIFQENSDLGVSAGEGETTPMNQPDKSYESVKHASGQPEDGNLKTMHEESSDFDVVASECETPPLNQLDESHKDVNYTSGQLDDGTVNVMLQQSPDLGESAAAKDNGPMRGQQKDVIAKRRGTGLFQKEDKNDKSIVAKCDDISSLASSTVNINLAQEKSSRIEQENLNNNPLAYNQVSCSHGRGKKPSLDQNEPWTSGESSNSGGSDIPPRVQSMIRDKSSNREMNAHGGNTEEPWVAGLCSGESSFKEADVPHCIKSMTEGNKTPTSNDLFLKKRKYEGATSTISTEPESCLITRKQRVLSVRKVPISKAAKIYGLRC